MTQEPIAVELCVGKTIATAESGSFVAKHLHYDEIVDLYLTRLTFTDGTFTVFGESTADYQGSTLQPVRVCKHCGDSIWCPDQDFPETWVDLDTDGDACPDGVVHEPEED